MSRNVFEFHPVGHGLFYTGSLYDTSYNFVFDCGSVSKKKYLSSEIDKYENSNIDFVVISHLHIDHFSGLKRLFDKAHIKKVYLPYIGYGNVLKLIIAYEVSTMRSSAQEKQELYKFIVNLYSSYQRDERYYNEQKKEIRVEIIGGYKNITSFDALIGNWHIMLINRSIDQDELKDLENKLSYLLNGEHIEDYISKNELADIKYIYYYFFGDRVNLTSTIMVHYPHYCRFSEIFNKSNDSLIRDNPIKNLSLLTGDVEFNADMLKDVEEVLKQHEGLVMQVPHHGSMKNWNLTKGLKNQFEIFTIPCGSGRKYGLPSISVISEIIRLHKELYFATEEESFKYEIMI